MELDIMDVKFVFNIKYNDKLSGFKFERYLLERYLTELLKLFYEVEGLERRSQVNVDYYPHKHKKRLPTRKKEPIGVEHANSGYCYVNSSEGDTNIVIFREEEFYKVLVHELIHLYKIVPYDTEFDNLINSKYGLTTHIITNESLVELVALIYNCIIINILTGKNDMRNFSNLIFKEKAWSSYVLSNIFKHYGRSIKNWKENTNVFAYYYVKKELLDYVTNNYKSTRSIIIPNKNNSLRMTINDVTKFKIT